MLKKCVICKKDFEAIGNTKCCNPDCSKILEKENAKKRWDEKYKNNKNIILNNKKRSREWYLKNKEKVKNKTSEWKKENPEKVKKYRLKDKKNCKKRHKVWRDKNRDHINNWIKKWRIDNPDRHRDISSRAKHKRRSILKAGGTYTKEEWLNILKEHEYKCAICGKSEKELNEKLTVDHIFPISKGGKNIASNLQPLCIGCNRRKSTYII